MKVLIPWNFNMLRNVPVALVQADPVLKGFFFVSYLPLYNFCSTFKPQLFHMVIQFFFF